MKLSLSILFLLAATSGCGQPTRSETASGQVGGPCEGCEAIFESDGPFSWTDTLPGFYEAGEPMVVSGTVFRSDGRTPAPGVLVYVYHTNAEGRYPTRGDETGWGRRHGYIRGWMRTDERGQYRFVSIRPANYPSGDMPAHIHIIVKEPDIDTPYWIEEYQFDDDQKLPESEHHKPHPHGGAGVISLVKNTQGVWEGTRDIILGLNVPHYPRQHRPAAKAGPPSYLMAAPGEPGERLVLSVRIVDKASGQPVPGAEAYFYQTDTSGRYHPLVPADESTARLHVAACTDDAGQFLLTTILPGEYPDAPRGSRHIHLKYLRAPGYQQITRVINFENNVNEQIRSWGHKTGFGIVVDIRKQEGRWKSEIVLELEKNEG